MEKLAASVVALSLLAFACSSSSTNNGTSSGASASSSSSSGGSSPVISSSDCSSRCQAKLTACNAPPAEVQNGCGQLCANQITEAQATCLEGKACDDIAKANSFNELCPAGSTSSSSSTSTSSTSSSGGSCTIGDAPKCNAAGDSIVKCESISGFPATVTTKCSDGKCKNAECGYCSTKSDCNSLASCKCKDGHTFGTTVSTDCTGGRCQKGLPDCVPGCQSHGGPS